MTNPFHPYPMPKLTCELVPKGLWFNNLRKMLTGGQWAALRQACYAKANHTCECCGNLRGKPPEAHEIWDYNDLTRVQTLIGLVSLCFLCHRVKHIGFARVQGQAQFTRAINHLAQVNEWPLELAVEYVARQFEIHEIRSELDWSQNLDWLNKAEQYKQEAEAAIRERKGQLLSRTFEAMRTQDTKE